MGCDVVTVSTDSKHVHLAWREHEKELAKVAFPMGADPAGGLSRMFGVWDDAFRHSERGIFLINPEGTCSGTEMNFYNVGRNIDELMRKFKANIYLAQEDHRGVPVEVERRGRQDPAAGREARGQGPRGPAGLRTDCRATRRPVWPACCVLRAIEGGFGGRMTLMFVKLAAVAAMAATGLAAVVAAQGGAAPKDPVRVKSDAIHAKVLTLDTHVDMRNGDYGVLTPGQKVDLVKMQQGGMKGVFLAVFVGQRQAFDAAAYKAAYDAAMRQFDTLDTLTQKTRPEMCAFAVSPDEVERVAKHRQARHHDRRRERLPGG